MVSNGITKSKYFHRLNLQGFNEATCAVFTVVGFIEVQRNGKDAEVLVGSNNDITHPFGRDNPSEPN